MDVLPVDPFASFCVFLGAPIQFAVDGNGRFSPNLREIIQGLISSLERAGIRVLSAHRHERFGEVDMVGKCREVCERDYAWMRECDVFAAVLPVGANGVPLSSGGTTVELGWASAMGKPVVLVRDMIAEYSYLIDGLDVVTTVASVDINSESVGRDLCGAARRVWEATGQIVGGSGI
jgi:nucleoside 2-deoxyribosyltransferase